MMTACPPRSYGSFCPVAQASEVVAQRWVPLILREIMVGWHRFNEIRRALPLISPSVLAQRLRSLERDGIVYRRSIDGAATWHLTPAGEELRPIVDALGHWARRWITRDYLAHELDPAVLMWSLQRHVLVPRFPDGRTVLSFRFPDAPPQRRYWWIVVTRGEADEIDVCMTDPGHPATLTITVPVRAMADVLLGDDELGRVRRTGVAAVEGPPALLGRFEELFDFVSGVDSFTGAVHGSDLRGGAPARLGG